MTIYYKQYHGRRLDGGGTAGLIVSIERPVAARLEASGHHEDVPHTGCVRTGVPVHAWEYQRDEVVPR
jgi:hypothetical protein